MVLRCGLLSLAAAIFFENVMNNLQPTLDFSSWYVWNAAAAIGLIVALAAWACYVSLGGQQIWKQDWLES
jgi:ABC-type nickel/cobalt efflux system permease component RcnA